MPLLITSPAREKSSRPIFLTSSSILNGSCPMRCRGAASARYPTRRPYGWPSWPRPGPSIPHQCGRGRWSGCASRYRRRTCLRGLSSCLLLHLGVDGQAGKRRARRGGLGLGVVTSEHLLSDPGAPDPLPSEGDRRRLQMRSAGVDVRRVPQAELDEDGRCDPYEVGDLIMPHEPAEVVWHLDVHVQREVGGGAYRGELGQRQVCGHVIRVRPEILHRLYGRRVCCRQLHGDLQDEVLGQLSVRLEVPQDPEESGVGDEYPAKP